MSIQSSLQNNAYIESKRTYSDDYSNTVSKKIDMTISGKYVGKYPKFNLNYNILDKYPHKYNIKKLECILKEKYSFDKEIIIGSGTNGLLQNIVKILFVNGGNLVTPYYTFDQAEYAVSSLGGITKRVIMNDELINFNNLYNSIDDKTKMIYICNPNNPTGVFIETNELLKKLKKINKKIPIVVDESSIEFSKCNSLIDRSLPNNIIVLRTFSKAFGLANLRVGYMICSNKFKELYNSKITINEVSGLSCDIVLQTLESKEYLNNINMIAEYRDKMMKELNNIGILTYESKSNIIMTASIFSNEVLNALFENDISVIKVKDINNQNHIRIAIQDKKTNNEFLRKLNKILKK